MAQLVKPPNSLHFGSGHDLMVPAIEPHVGLRADSAKPAWDSLSPRTAPGPPSSLPPLTGSLSLSLSQNK